MDYLKRWRIPCYTTAKLYQKIRDAFPEVHLEDINFVNSMILDGSVLSGASSFQTEEKDLIFLAGNLSLQGHKKIMVIVGDKTKFTDVKTVVREHNDVFKNLKNLGFDSMRCKFEDIVGFVGLITYIDPEYADQHSSK